MLKHVLIAGLVTAVSATTYAGEMTAKMPHTTTDPMFDQALEQAELGKYNASLKTLALLKERGEASADVYTMMAYNNRKLKNYEAAFELYRKALEINPHHIQALEYYGEGLVEVGKIDKAKNHLATLEQVCGRTCAQYRTLKNLIDAKTGAKPAKPKGKW